MQLEDLYQVGYIYQPKSLKGELKAFFEAFFLSYLQESKTKLPYLIIQTKQGFLPFFVEKVQVQKDGNVLIKFEDINSLEAAISLQNTELFFDKSKIPDSFFSDEEEEEEEDWDFLLGFTLIDASTNQAIATIEDIYYLPAHELAQITIQNKEVLIPLHEDLIADIDEDEQTITFNLPEGLIDAQLHTHKDEDKDVD